LDCRIAAAVQNLAPDNVDDCSHGGVSLLHSLRAACSECRGSRQAGPDRPSSRRARMPYVDRVLQEGESVRHIARISWVTYLPGLFLDRKSTRLNSSHGSISYAVFCLKKKKQTKHNI